MTSIDQTTEEELINHRGNIYPSSAGDVHIFEMPEMESLQGVFSTLVCTKKQTNDPPGTDQGFGVHPPSLMPRSLFAKLVVWSCTVLVPII